MTLAFVAWQIKIVERVENPQTFRVVCQINMTGNGYLNLPQADWDCRHLIKQRRQCAGEGTGR